MPPNDNPITHTHSTNPLVVLTQVASITENAPTVLGALHNSPFCQRQREQELTYSQSYVHTCKQHPV